ncbi:MAG: hypothetical protein V1793_06535 [Pseudomonadota bacterium]
MKKLAGLPGVHLWIYNHPFLGISDQVSFFIHASRQKGYRVSVGNRPEISKLNVVIENFSAMTREPLKEFCTSTGKRVAVIMTEHLDFVDNRILIHGDPLWSSNDYMHPGIQFDRIRYLMESLPYIRCLFVLGDLPELKNSVSMIPGVVLRAIPFPFLAEKLRTPPPVMGKGGSDLVFTGVLTDYRRYLITLLRENRFTVDCPDRFVSCWKRTQLNRCSKINLNLPQRETWRWLSLMRIIASLRCGRATVSVGTQDDSRIAACTYQLRLDTGDWQELLRACVADWRGLYRNAWEAYNAMAEDFEASLGFPHDLFDYWAMTDSGRQSIQRTP